MKSVALPPAGSDKEKYQFMQILGRIVGFEAIVPGRDPGKSRVWIPGTATVHNDPHTIMIEDQLVYTGLQRTGFSDQDIKAFQLVYPEHIPAPQITTSVPVDKMQLGEYYEISATYNHIPCPDPEWQWSWKETHNNSSFSVIQSGNNTVSVCFYKPGIYQFTAGVTNFGKEPITRTLTIDLMRFADTKPAITIEPTDSVELGKHYTVSASYNNPSCPDPVFAFSVKDTLYGSKIPVTPIENGKVDILISNPGQFRVTATVTNADPQVSADLDLQPVYKKYNYVFLKHDTKIVDRFNITGRGPVNAIGNYLSFYIDGNMTKPVFLDQNLTIRVKRMQFLATSPTDPGQLTVVSDKVKTVKVHGMLYELEETFRSDFRIGTFDNWLEVEFISLGD